MKKHEEVNPEGKAGEESSGELASPKKPWKRILLYSFGAMLLIALIVAIAIPPDMGHPYPKLLGCQDNLRSMDMAIMQYEKDRGEGVYPTTIEELVGDYHQGYLNEILQEPYGGYYYLDTSTSPPHAVCSEGHTY
jgi:hypothetical protein